MSSKSESSASNSYWRCDVVVVCEEEFDSGGLLETTKAPNSLVLHFKSRSAKSTSSSMLSSDLNKGWSKSISAVSFLIISDVGDFVTASDEIIERRLQK